MSRNPEELIKKYLENSCTPEERSLLESWYNAKAGSMEDTDANLDYLKLESELWEELAKKTKPAKRLYWPLMAAASIACLAIAALLYYSYSGTAIQQPETLMTA